MNTSYRPFVVCTAIVVSGFSLIGVWSTECQAAEQKRTYLTDRFQDGDIPTGQDFADTIDSALNFIDDGFALIGTGTGSDGGALYLVDGATVDGSLSYGQPAGLSNAWAGNFGYLPVTFSDGPTTHYGYFQLSSGQPGTSELYPMHFQYFVWEDQAGAALITAPVPEPSTGLLCCVGLASFIAYARRRRSTAGNLR